MTVINLYRNKILAFAISLVSLVILAPCVVFAQAPISTTNLSDQFFRIGNGLAVGGAYRAIADSPNAIQYNPAGIAQLKGQTRAAGDYAYEGDMSAQMYGVSVVDFQTSPTVAYGLSFHRFTPTVAGVSGNVNQTIISFAYTLGNFFQIGASGKGYWINIDSPVLQGPRGLDMDLGAILKPFKILSFAVTGYNLFRGNNIEEFPLMLGFGGALIFTDQAKFAFDMVHNFNTPSPDKTNYHLGADIKVAEAFALRGGFAFDQVANNNYYSLGGALVGEAADLMFTFSQRMSPSSETYAINASFKF